MTLPVRIVGIGVRGPGLPDWPGCRDTLREPASHVPGPLSRPVGQGLPATERRRATTVTRLALDVAAEALAGHDAGQVAAVFASSGGEVDVVHGIFEQLAGTDRRLSPTAFHNSVHNAAAGHWSIASGSHAAADSLCGYDDSFGVGLAEACLRCQEGDSPVLLVACDWPPLFPIAEFRPITQPFAVALLLQADGPAGPGLAGLAVDYRPVPAHAESLPGPTLEQLRTDNPAARSLPLLAAIAAGRPARLSLGHGMGGSLRIEVEPCG